MQKTKPKFKIGDKIITQDTSWDDKDNKFTMHGKIVGMSWHDSYEGGSGWLYNVLWDKKDVEKLWGIDREDYEAKNKDPKQYYEAERGLNKI